MTETKTISTALPKDSLFTEAMLDGTSKYRPESFTKTDHRLIWFPELGVGYFPATEFANAWSVYDAAYFDKYVSYEATEIGESLNKARLDLVAKYLPEGNVLDVGIGSGAFVRACPHSYGIDISVHAKQKLREWNLLFDVNRPQYVEGITFFDSLEHIEQPDFYFKLRAKYIFVSLPIFESAEHVLQSKHFRKDEHCHYFTTEGLLRTMDELDYYCVEQNSMESDLGREGIGTFVFRRK